MCSLIIETVAKAFLETVSIDRTLYSAGFIKSIIYRHASVFSKSLGGNLDYGRRLAPLIFALIDHADDIQNQRFLNPLPQYLLQAAFFLDIGPDDGIRDFIGR